MCVFKKFRSLMVFAIAATLLSGCTETELVSHWWKSGTKPITSVGTASGQQGNFKVGNAYQIEGKWYTPSESYSYDETGISSWYGDEFHGKRTANGETFDKNALTAAHPTLQLPSLIRVTNLENGRSAVLRVNDRGPFSKSRLIDVSHKAANVLGYANQGTARVRVQVLERESRILAEAARKGYSPNEQMAMAFRRTGTEVQPQADYQVASAGSLSMPPVASPVTSSDDLPPPTHVDRMDIENLNKQLFRKYPVSPTSLYIQVGAFANAANANAMRQKLSSMGNAQIFPTTVNGQPFNRVRLGPLQSVATADNTLKKVLNAGFSGARIVVD